MRVHRIRAAKAIFPVILSLLAMLVVPSYVPIANATATSCTTTSCAVSPKVTTAFTGGIGDMASEAKIDQSSSYSDGQTAVYGGANPNIWIGLQGSLSASGRGTWNPTTNIQSLAISVQIRDSSNNIYPITADSNGHGGISTNVEWAGPYPTGDSTDYANLFADLSTWLLSLLGPGVPTPPNFPTTQTVPNGVFRDTTNNAVIAQWTFYHDPCSDTPLHVCGSDGSHLNGVGGELFDKFIRLKVIPSFYTPDVYTITVTTTASRGQCDQGTGIGSGTVYCYVTQTQTQSYSFKYVYEMDAGQDGDASNTLSNAGGNPRSIQPGSYSGFLYGIDTADVYSFYANQGESIALLETPPPGADFSISAYDPGSHVIQSQDLGTGVTSSASFTASTTGTYFVMISLVTGWGTYFLSLSDNTYTMTANPTSVNLGPAGTAGSQSSTITFSSIGNFAGTVELSTSISPAVTNGPTASLSPVSTSEVTVVSPNGLGAFWYVDSPGNAFVSDGQYAYFHTDCTGCDANDAYANYLIPAPNIPSGSPITKVEVLLQHYEPSTSFGTVGIQFPTVTYFAPLHTNVQTDAIDITSLHPSWSTSNLPTALFLIANTIGKAYVDWIALRVTYLTPAVPLTAGSSGSRTLTISSSASTPPGTYSVGVTTPSSKMTVLATVQDFTISASPASMTLLPGQQLTSTITVAPFGSFAGDVTLFVSSPANFLVGLSSNTIHGGSGSVTLSVSLTGTPSPDPATITVKGTSGSLSHNTNIIVTNPPPTFSLTSNPTQIVAVAGTSTALTFTVTGLYGFSGTVSLSQGIPNGLSCTTLSQSSVTLTSSSPTSTPTATSTVSCYAQAGLYTLNVTGVSGSLASFALAPFTVTDFSMSSTVPSPIDANSQVTIPVSVAGINGFSGTVNLSVKIYPCIMSCSDGSFPVATWADTGNNRTTAQPSSCPSTNCAKSLILKANPAVGEFNMLVLGTCANCGPGANNHVISSTFWIQCDPKNGTPPSEFCMWPDSSSVSVQQNVVPGDTIYLNSNAGFSGTATLTTSISGCNYNCGSGTAPIVFWNDTRTTSTTAKIDPNSSSCTPGPVLYCAKTLLIIQAGTATGDYTVTVTAVCPSTCTSAQTHVVKIDFYVYASGGGGGGSVAAGTMIMLPDGSQVPVEQLREGMQILSYDLTTHEYLVTTITRFTTVIVHNEMTITTSDHRTLTTDQNPAQKLYVKLHNGTIVLMPVTDLKVGYRVYDAITQKWVKIESITYVNTGTYTMYDIYPTAPGNYIANGILDPLKT